MSYAEAWLKWFEVIERGAGPLSARMLELGAVDRARQVLDIGTGIGDPALAAANEIGPEGWVIAIDSDPDMIAIGRNRAAAYGLGNIEFEVADIDSLPVDARSLDVILARWSLMFVEDLAAVLAKLAQALRPGGRLVIAAWAAAERVPALTLARRTVHAHFGWPAPAQGAGTPFALADKAHTEAALAAAGLTDIASEEFPVTYEYLSLSDYIQNRIDLTGPLWDGMDSATDEVRSAVFGAIETALKSHRGADGIYRLTNQAICYSAHRS